MPLGGSQPHLSQRYWGTPAGFFAPHSGQNLPLFTDPQAHVQPSSAGFLAPHSVQNLPVAVAPQEGHFQPPAGAAGAAGAGAAACCCWAI